MLVGVMIVVSYGNMVWQGMQEEEIERMWVRVRLWDAGKE